MFCLLTPTFLKTDYINSTQGCSLCNLFYSCMESWQLLKRHTKISTFICSPSHTYQTDIERWHYAWLYIGLTHSRPQRLQSFWSAPRIEISACRCIFEHAQSGDSFWLKPIRFKWSPSITDFHVGTGVATLKDWGLNHFNIIMPSFRPSALSRAISNWFIVICSPDLPAGQM